MNKLFCIFAVATSMIFTACEKEEVINFDIQKKKIF